MTERTNPKFADRSQILAMTYTALFTVLIAVCSWISIPTTVPFTLQTFAIFLTLLLLGGRNGTLAILCYLLLGALGAPVFAGFAGGIGILAGPTGGYLVGFLVMGLCYLLITARFGEGRFVNLIAILTGTVLLYVFGTVWFVHVYTANTGPVTYGTALLLCVVPFLLLEVCKLALAFLLAAALVSHVKSCVENRGFFWQPFWQLFVSIFAFLRVRHEGFCPFRFESLSARNKKAIPAVSHFCWCAMRDFASAAASAARAGIAGLGRSLLESPQGFLPALAPFRVRIPLCS